MSGYTSRVVHSSLSIHFRKNRANIKKKEKTQLQRRRRKGGEAKRDEEIKEEADEQ